MEDLLIEFKDVTKRFGNRTILDNVNLKVYDNDGDTDVVITNNSGPARLLINMVGSKNAWLGVRLVEKKGIPAKWISPKPT